MKNEGRKKVVYTAQSKYYYFAKMMVAKYVLEHDAVPLNPFNNWSYFMNDMVDRELVISANASLVDLSDEIWVFGSVADGVLAEMRMGMAQGKSIRFFSLGKTYEEIQEIGIEDLTFEENVLRKEEKERLLQEFSNME